MLTLAQVIVNGKYAYQLLLDGKDLNVEVEHRYKPLFIYASDPDVLNLLLSQSFSDLSELPEQIIFTECPNLLKVWEELADTCTLTIRPEGVPENRRFGENISLSDGTKTAQYKYEIQLIGSPGLWRYPWTIKEHKLEFMSILESMNIPALSWAEFDRSNELSYVFPEIKYSFLVADNKEQIRAEITRGAEIICEINEQTENLLIERLDAGSLVAYFRFLPEVKAACSQYLLYFTQFLRDLGVEANTALTNEADQVLFKITPVNKREALEKIRMALHVFLKLPSASIEDVASEGIAIQKLEANILRLRGDLKLAAAEVEAKNATIEAQKLIIDVQKGLLNGDIMSHSMREVTPKPNGKDEEELLGGTVALIPVEGKGIRVNLPEIFRKLRRLFSETD